MEVLGDDLNRLDAIRPYQWFNIPAPVVDAVSILLEQSKINKDRIKHLMRELEQTQASFAQKQKRNKESINEVLEYCKGEIGSQAETLSTNMKELRSNVRST